MYNTIIVNICCYISVQTDSFASFLCSVTETTEVKSWHLTISTFPCCCFSVTGYSIPFILIYFFSFNKNFGDSLSELIFFAFADFIYSFLTTLKKFTNLSLPSIPLVISINGNIHLYFVYLGLGV